MLLGPAIGALHVDTEAPSPPVAEPPGVAEYDAAAVFAADSFWNAPLADGAPLHSSSTTWARNLCTQLGVDPDSPASAYMPNVLPGAVPGQAWFNKQAGGTPVYVVPADQPKVSVANVQTMEGWGWQTVWDLHAAFMGGVPIPPYAFVDQSDDKSLVIYQPSTDTMWELWVAEHRPGTYQGLPYEWTCYGGGRMVGCSTRRGTYRDQVGPLENWYWGHTATGLPMIGGSITPEEWNSEDPESIRHALHMVVSNAAAMYVPPAHRHDGEMDGSWIAEGARVRFPADIDFSAYLDPDVPRQRHIWQLGHAIQRYGIMVTDKTHGGCALRFRSPVSYWSEGVGDPFVMEDYGHEYLWPLPWHRAQIVDPSVSPE